MSNVRGRAVPSLVCVGILIGLATPASAARLAGWGVRSGVSIARFSRSIDAFESSSRLGFAGGVYPQIALNGRFSFQPEVWWISKGGEEDAHVTITSSGQPPQELDFHVEHTLDYVEIPILARLNVTTIALVQPYFITGPAVAFRTSARSNFEGSGWTVVSAPAGVQMAQIFEDVGPSPDLEKFDWGWVGGGGVLLGRGSVRFGVEARYSYGLSNLLREGATGEAHNEALVVTAGIELQ